MMNELQMKQEKSVLRWGGLAGILGGVLLLAVFVIVGVFVGPDPAEPEGLVERFPDVRVAHVVEEVLYLGVLALWAVHTLPRNPYASALKVLTNSFRVARCSSVRRGVAPGGGQCLRASMPPPSRARLIHWLTAPLLTPRA